MKDDVFIFDCVVHAYDVSDENLLPVPGAELAREISARGGGRNLPPIREMAHGPDSETGYPENVNHAWTPEELYAIEFEGTGVDMAMAQTIPVYDWFERGLSPVEANYAFAAQYPDKVLFAGGVDPSYHTEGIYEEMERQVEEWDARAFKFYNAHANGKSWRCDDEKVAYPMYEKARDLGIDVLQFHKGIALGTTNIEDLRPNDIQRAAADFPDMQFVIYHLAIPYFAECVSIGARFPNVHLALSGNVNYGFVQPRVLLQQVGELLLHVGSDSLIFGSEAPVLGGPEPYIDLLLDLEMPEDLQEGFGYPQITMDDKRKMLGGNFAKLLGVPVPGAEPAPVQASG